MVVLSNYVWIHGGTDDSGTERSSLWSLRVPGDWDAIGNWTEYADQEPGPRSMHCSAVRDGRAYVWGGQPGMYLCMCVSVCEYVTGLSMRIKRRARAACTARLCAVRMYGLDSLVCT
jgi:hypothetical protein